MVVDEIRLRLRKRKVRHTFHALKEEMKESLTAREVEEALLQGFELVEDYPNDSRGHSCLVLTWVKERLKLMGLSEKIILGVSAIEDAGYIPNTKKGVLEKVGFLAL